MDNPIISPDEVRATERLIRPFVRRTPVIEVESADFGFGRYPMTLKLELMQHAGSFKVRGVFTNLLTRTVPEAGIVAASGGNHGVAIAFAAMTLDVRATVFVPTVAAALKVERIREYGAALVIGGDRYADALAASEKWASESGAMPVHAYDQTETLLGQATTALELEQQAPDLTTIFVSVGGGGFIGGIAAWYAGRAKIIGVEPEAAPTLHNALVAGKPVDAPAGGIAADSLAPRRVGDLMFPIAQRYVDHVILVSDDEIREAQSLIWKTMRIVTEPGGAAAFAALATGKYQPVVGERVGVVLCGGNTDAVRF